jgi:hypothetical protein
MQRIDEIINYLNKKTISNEHCFVLKNRIKYRDEDGYPNYSGYIVRTSKKSVWVVGCDDIFDEGSVVRRLRNSKVSHACPFVGCDDIFDEGSVVRRLRNSKVSHARPFVGCDDIFDEGSVVRRLRNSKVSHARPFVGEVLSTVINYHMVDRRGAL